MDARVRYTKMMIRQVFLEQLSERELSKITVKGICDAADINRATFYKYYDNPYDLLDKLEIEQLEQLQKKIEENMAEDKEERLRSVFATVLSDLKENAQIYMTLFSENGDKSFRQKLFSLCYNDNMQTIEECFPNMSQEYRNWLYYFIAEGCNGILSQWMEGGMTASIEEVLDFTVSLIETINRTYTFPVHKR